MVLLLRAGTNGSVSKAVYLNYTVVLFTYSYSDRIEAGTYLIAAMAGGDVS